IPAAGAGQPTHQYEDFLANPGNCRPLSGHIDLSAFRPERRSQSSFSHFLSATSDLTHRHPWMDLHCGEAGTGTRYRRTTGILESTVCTRVFTVFLGDMETGRFRKPSCR